jgi:hypothetical protein
MVAVGLTPSQLQLIGANVEGEHAEPWSTNPLYLISTVIQNR